MSKLYSLRVTSGSWSVREYWEVVFCCLFKGRGLPFLITLFNDKLKWINSNTDSPRCFFLSCSSFIEWDETSDRFGESLFFHLYNFFDVVVGGKNSRKFGLFYDVVHWLKTHRIEESNTCHSVVHVCDVSNQPFVSIFGPETDELPFLTVTLCLVGKV